MKYILLFIAFCFVVDAGELRDLVTRYNQETQLHEDTKKEAAGHVIVFTREDLDRMQAYTLNDILNTIRMFNLVASRNGGTSFVFSGAKSNSLSPIRIFINNHELNSATFGSPLIQYGAMNLYFVDYIEVYQAGNSITFGNESGSVVVRLYTKKPRLENATYSELTFDSKGSEQLNVFTAKSIDDRYSYLLNMNVNNRNMDSTRLNGYTLSKDYTIGHLFFQFNKKDDYSIDIEATKGKKDTFVSLSLTPSKSDMDGENAYIHIDKHFASDILLKASASIENTWMDYLDGKKLRLSDGTNAKKIDAHMQTTTLSLILEKKFTIQKNELTLATKFKQRKGKLYNFTADNIQKDMIKGPTEFNAYSLYGEDLYSFNDSNMLVLGLKYNYMTYNNSKNPNDSFLYRLGYISHYKSFTNKIFIFNRVNQPTMGQQSFSPVKIKSNSNLKPININIISADSAYSLNQDTSIDTAVACAKATDVIGVDPVAKKYINTDKTIYFQRVYVRIKHNFNLYNKIMVGFYKVFRDKSFSPDNGALIQLFNQVGRFKIYNELVYRGSYTNEVHKSLDAGYDYSLAISYPISKKSTLKVKGENIFDSASEIYIYDAPAGDGIYESARQQRAMLSWEYEF